MDAKNRRKLRRAHERQLKEEGIDPSTVWLAMPPSNKKEPKYKPIPGQDFYEETAEWKAKVESNRWEENFDEVITFIKEATKEDSDWSWARNMDCKYINLRIDMRDGGFVIVADGKRISLDALKWQYRSKDE